MNSLYLFDMASSISYWKMNGFVQKLTTQEYEESSRTIR